jgi:hypothetical protein
MILELLLLVQSYRLPYEENRSFACTQGNHGSVSHTGNLAYSFDFGLPEGTPVCAARGGKVVGVKEDLTGGGLTPEYRGKANFVKIDHGDGTVASYLHLKNDGALVEVGQIVEQGDVIGLSGATGYVTGPHLHFQVERDGKSVAIRFEDVPGDGVPVEGKSYRSANGTMISRSASLAFRYGLYGAAYVRYVKMKAKDRVKEIEDLAEQVLESDDPDVLARAKIQFRGMPAVKKIEERFRKLKGDPFRRVPDETFYKALQYEVDGHAPLALKYYRQCKDDERAKQRIEALTAK